MTVPEIRQGLYADLQDNRILIEFDAPTPEALLHRYNLSQTQGGVLQGQQNGDAPVPQ